MASTEQTAGGLSIVCVRPRDMDDLDWEYESEAWEALCALLSSLILARRSRCLVAVRLEPDEIRLPEAVG